MERSNIGSVGLRPVGQPGWSKVTAVVRDLRGLPPVLARAGTLELRLATSKKEVRKAQRLRYDIFYVEGDATPDAYKSLLQRDKCPFDKVCDHLLAVETDHRDRFGRTKDKVVGTYRLLSGDMARAHFGFYSETEFNLGPLLDRHPDKRLLELGRSCVHPKYRSRRVIDLLWSGIGRYSAHHGIDALIGCASLAGTRASSLAMPLSFAFHHAAAPPAWQVEAVAHRATRMDLLDKDAVKPREAIAQLPPLMKAYLRAGAKFASQAAVDYAFGTTDLFTVLPLASTDPRYFARFGVTA